LEPRPFRRQHADEFGEGSYHVDQHPTPAAAGQVRVRGQTGNRKETRVCQPSLFHAFRRPGACPLEVHVGF
jgi:hypothetical protein